MSEIDTSTTAVAVLVHDLLSSRAVNIQNQERVPTGAEKRAAAMLGPLAAERDEAVARAKRAQGVVGQWAERCASIQARVAAQEAALKKAARVFRWYQSLHMGKNPPAIEKANRNAEYAGMCESALAAPPAPQTVNDPLTIGPAPAQQPEMSQAALDVLAEHFVDAGDRLDALYPERIQGFTYPERQSPHVVRDVYLTTELWSGTDHAAMMRQCRIERVRLVLAEVERLDRTSPSQRRGCGKTSTGRKDDEL